MYVYGNVSLSYSWSEKAPERIVDRIETHILHLIQFVRKSCRLETTGKIRHKEATDSNEEHRMRAAYWITGAAVSLRMNNT